MDIIFDYTYGSIHDAKPIIAKKKTPKLGCLALESSSRQAQYGSISRMHAGMRSVAVIYYANISTNSLTII
jgi:hypothetical protein